mmetsp:Transcript_26368/g.40299  ORF Transcript_26368/g.40299 Transcript_26368/m.40299 type:complete len:375 (+) Transcript_26368:265-1389(+)|eukprot:CAMPEP_0194084628 /NCGR_PEP_ID=MMETSP0149-20130528/14043_1 /TAXON_ID=122233 /ORGANISM="Chaetoceros debilis, Strain MM31A-1" /LENGTH=374 /DNA_ID=CAMNT_0038767327 /DNA_START=247 /DNA_END=1371 /DNA_ORIENTATION=+
MPSDATPWVEKYRPRNLNEVSHQTEVVSTLQNAVETNRLPHLLLYGPPGTGKTSVALALCRTLWHPSQYNRRVLELNASDERGIDIVRNKIKQFASLSVGSGPANRKKFFGASGASNMDIDGEEEDEVQYPNPPFKIIILDEADTVTPDAQAALRRIIEAHSKITRFILICNYVTRIIEPLASRCAKFRFQSLPPASMMNRLVEIGTAEGCKYEKSGTDDDSDGQQTVLMEILNLSQGDMRRAVTTLQSAHSLSRNGSDDGGCIRANDIAEMAGLPPSNIIQTLMGIFHDPKSDFETMEKAVADTMMEGYSAQHVMKALLEKLIALDDKKLNEANKARIAIKIAEADKNLVDCADEKLQLLLVCSLTLKCFKGM